VGFRNGVGKAEAKLREPVKTVPLLLANNSSGVRSIICMILYTFTRGYLLLGYKEAKYGAGAGTSG
jgi:hypothetical protein